MPHLFISDFQSTISEVTINKGSHKQKSICKSCFANPLPEQKAKQQADEMSCGWGGVHSSACDVSLEDAKFSDWHHNHVLQCVEEVIQSKPSEINY